MDCTDYTGYSEANYWYTIFEFINILKRYGEEQVMFDLEDTLERLEMEEDKNG